MAFDVLIKNGTVVDGTGHPRLKQDVGIKDGRVVELKAGIKTDAVRTIDAEGLVVAPGFIDIHSHSDRTLSIFRKAESSIRQGITTVLGGQCGGSAAPLSPQQKAMLEKRGLAAPWNSFGEFLSTLEKQGIAINFACLVGQGSVRGYVMGNEDRPPTEAELSQMKQLVREAMECGAYGISTGRRYMPGCLASHEEVIELCKVAAEYGGVYMSHIRNQDVDIFPSLEELIDVGRVTGIKVHLAHQKVCGKPNWGRAAETLRLMESAREEGIDILSDLYPHWYTQITQLKALLPGWVNEGGTAQLLARLEDESIVARLRAELEEFARNNAERWHSLAQTGIIWCEGTPELIGSSLAEASEALGLSMPEAWIWLLKKNNGDVKTAGIMSEEDIRAIIAHPYSMFGTDSFSIDGKLISSAEAHPRNYGTYPYVLSKYVREEGLISLEIAIHKMSGYPARQLGLSKRGLLKPGFWADVTIFDPQAIADKSSITTPCEYPEGIEFVLVNGQVVVEKSAQHDVFVGQVLRHTR